MKTTTTMLMKPTVALVPYAHNARIHDDDQILALRASLREFGFVAPVLIDSADNILAGHARLAAAKAEGLSEVPCVLVEHLSELQRRAYILADNRLAEQATWDEDLVSLELQSLSEAGFEFSLTGFDDGDLILDEPNEVREDECELPIPIEPHASPGDLYQLGRHRLLCGDATVLQDVSRLMNHEDADLLLTDPPYNVDITGGGAEKLKLENDKLSDEDFEGFLALAFHCATKVLSPGAGFYIWHADGFPALAFRKACQAAGLRVRQCLIWVKQSATLSRQDYHWQHEPCLHGEAELPSEAEDEGETHESCLYGWKDGRAHLWCSDRKQTSVLHFDRPSRSAEHPTMKPVQLFAYQITNSTLPDAIVFDPFCGSGTSVIACEQLGRAAYVLEKDPRYVDVIIARWESFSGERAVKLCEP